MSNFEKKIILTVTQLNSIIKDLLNESLSNIYVEGEVSNVRSYQSGHVYFILKDESSQLQAIIFKNVLSQIKFNIENGQKLICYGHVDLYQVRGDLRFIVYDVVPKGIGSLQLAFEQLKQKLQKEGLFDISRKKQIPAFPTRIGIITSVYGAAIRDILTVIKRRNANVNIYVYNVKVQGSGAKEEIVQAIRDLNKDFSFLDVILLGRGGGSIEDLWTFNEESVARAIASSKIPIISCVGHEIDYTIADYVADLRAPTPSAAAEIVVKSKQDLLEKIDTLRKILYSRTVKNIKYFFENKFQLVAELENRLNLALTHFLEKKKYDFNILKEKLNLLSPFSILRRGYAIAWYKNKPLKDASITDLNDTIRVQLFKGSLDTVIKSKYD